MSASQDEGVISRNLNLKMIGDTSQDGPISRCGITPISRRGHLKMGPHPVSRCDHGTSQDATWPHLKTTTSQDGTSLHLKTRPHPVSRRDITPSQDDHISRHDLTHLKMGPHPITKLHRLKMQPHPVLRRDLSTTQDGTTSQDETPPGRDRPTSVSATPHRRGTLPGDACQSLAHA